MKRKFFVLFTIVAVSLLCFGCRKDAPPQFSATTASASDATEDMIYEFSTEIIRGTIEQKTDEYFTNPDGKGSARNVRITEYEVKILEVFKGDIKEESITVRTYNGADLPAEEFDPESAENFYLPIGQECILSLYSYEDQAGYETGWNCVPLYGDQSLFLPTETEGQFENSIGIVLDANTLAQSISE